MSLLFNAVKASEGLFKPLRLQRYNKKMIYANKNKKKRTRGATPAFIRIGRGLGVCVYKDEGRYGITNKSMVGASLPAAPPVRIAKSRQSSMPIPRVHEKAKRAKHSVLIHWTDRAAAEGEEGTETLALVLLARREFCDGSDFLDLGLQRRQESVF